MKAKTYERYMTRTCRLIERNGFIVIKSGNWYLSHWSNLAGGEDCLQWACREHALTFDNLAVAFAFLDVIRARDAKVVSFFPPKRAA